MEHDDVVNNLVKDLFFSGKFNTFAGDYQKESNLYGFCYDINQFGEQAFDNMKILVSTVSSDNSISVNYILTDNQWSAEVNVNFGCTQYKYLFFNR